MVNDNYGHLPKSIGKSDPYLHKSLPRHSPALLDWATVFSINQAKKKMQSRYGAKKRPAGKKHCIWKVCLMPQNATRQGLCCKSERLTLLYIYTLMMMMMMAMMVLFVTTIQWLYEPTSQLPRRRKASPEVVCPAKPPHACVTND